MISGCKTQFTSSSPILANSYRKAKYSVRCLLWGLTPCSMIERRVLTKRVTQDRLPISSTGPSMSSELNRHRSRGSETEVSKDTSKLFSSCGATSFFSQSLVWHRHGVTQSSCLDLCGHLISQTQHCVCAASLAWQKCTTWDLSGLCC